MELRLYDTLTRPSEPKPFRPLDPKNVRMYVCGPTVYDFAHIGNARPVIVFDVLFRLLREIYGEDNVTYVRNITDVDDKINARAAEEFPGIPLNKAIRKLTTRTAQQFHADVAELRCLPPTIEPRATKHIKQMKAVISRLLKRKRAYVLKEHVLFRVRGLRSYGKLSHRSLEEMRAGARGEVAPKRNSMDFVLWKPSKPGEPSWPSPGGIKSRGRPGWHIECSAMSWAYLGTTFDIHGGGIDLVFPHHENEIAQTCCAFQTKVMANFWMHNGFLQVEGRKMAKSEGNFTTIHELLHTSNFGDRSWSGGTLRLAMLRTHYRQPIDWTVDNLRRADENLDRWRTFAGERTTKSYDRKAFDRFMNFLADDLNTPGALSVVDEIVASESPTPDQRFFVYKALKLLGFEVPLSPTKRASNAVVRALTALERLPDNYIQYITEKALTHDRYRTGKFRPEASLVFGLTLLNSLAISRNLALGDSAQISDYAKAIGIRNTVKINELIAARTAARLRKDFQEADRIRAELAGMGILLKDRKDGRSTWEIAR